MFFGRKMGLCESAVYKENVTFEHFHFTFILTYFLLYNVFKG